MTINKSELTLAELLSWLRGGDFERASGELQRRFEHLLPDDPDLSRWGAWPFKRAFRELRDNAVHASDIELTIRRHINESHRRAIQRRNTGDDVIGSVQ